MMRSDGETKRVYKIEEIAEIVRPIAENCGAGKIYLFGSYARGTDPSLKS